MGSSKPEVKGRLSGRTFWDVAHGDLVERHPRMYVVVIILLIILLLALAAYLLLDIANHSSLPPISKAMPQGFFSEGSSLSIPSNDMLCNTTSSCEAASTQNSTRSQELSPSQEIAASSNGSFKSLFPLNLQYSSAVLAAGVGYLADAAAHSISPDGMSSRISGPAKAFQEFLWQLPSSINSWASPTLKPLLKSLGDNARWIGDNAREVPLQRTNISLKFPSLIAH